MKKIIAIMLMVIIAVCCVACTPATKAAEITVPGVIGLNHLDTVKDLNDRYATGEINLEYEIRMGQLEGYWTVYLEGEVAGETYAAGGFYDHVPSMEEIDILWTVRIPCDQFESLIEGLGF